MVNSMQERKKRRFNCCIMLFVGCLALGILYGCSNHKYITSFSRPDFDINRFRRIAVLPLDNLTSDVAAAEKIRRAVTIELLSRGIDIIEDGEVSRVLREMAEKQRQRPVLSSSDIRHIGKALEVQAVMKGSVGSLGYSEGILTVYPEVSVNLTLINTASSQITWSISYVGGGASFWTRRFGAEGKTLEETIREVVKNAIDNMFYRKT
ncbi:MAG: hypothetical protein ABFR82_09945 [Nitrospirota bacterium]